MAHDRGLRLAFLTATPLDFTRGSGTFAGITTLARGLESHGASIEFFTPGLRLPVFTLERLWFNERLRRLDLRDFDAVVGFDMDGYRVRAHRHIASIKGVIADEMRFERGVTRRTMAIQAACERQHVRRADLVLTTSHYAAGRVRELYGVEADIVPESIDLCAWRSLFDRNPATPDGGNFTVLSVCRLYPRKRLEVLLRAAARLKPAIAMRIVGRGPEEARLHALARTLGLERVVRWLGDISQDQLASEYNRADVFCLPSLQEGFGIVFLEAMAAGKPIVAARAAAAPEVVTAGLLTEPDSDADLAAALDSLRRNPALRQRLGEAGRRAVEQYDSSRVAGLFLEKVRSALP